MYDYPSEGSEVKERGVKERGVKERGVKERGGEGREGTLVICRTFHSMQPPSCALCGPGCLSRLIRRFTT